MKRHQAMVYSMAYHFLGDPPAAEEVAQDVFFQLYRNLGAIKSVSHLTFWLRKVTAHRSIDRARRRKWDPPSSLDDVPEPVAPGSSPDSTPDSAYDPAMSERLQRLVRALPEKRRMVMILRYQEELELHEIAELLDMPINSVKSCLQRSLAILREKLTRCLGDVRV